MNDQQFLPIASDINLTSISVREDTTLEEWRDQFLKIERGTRKLLWYLGDLAAFGISKWPQAVKEFLEASDFEKTTIEGAAWVCRNIEPSRRRDDVSFSVHKEVAGLLPAQQDEWLEHYVSQKNKGPYSISQFRADMRQQLAEPELREISAPNRSVIRGVREFLTFTKRQPQDFWTPEMKQSYRQELQPLVEFYNSL